MPEIIERTWRGEIIAMIEQLRRARIELDGLDDAEDRPAALERLAGRIERVEHGCRELAVRIRHVIEPMDES